MRRVKKTIILIIGGTLIFFGVLLLVLPGPGLLVIIAGLAVLATEFAFAEKALSRVRKSVTKVGERVKKRKPGNK